MLAISRRHFCAALPVAISPALSILTPALAEASPDAGILSAVWYWLQIDPALADLWERRDAAFDAAVAAIGECPMDDATANGLWWDAYADTEAGRLEWAWQDLANVSDGYLTYAVNTPAKTPQGIAAKVRLLRVFLERQGTDDDDYILTHIEADIDPLSSRGRV